MYNNNNNNKNSFSSDHRNVVGNMSPRISFSNDFVESHSRLMNLHPSPPPPVSSDFEFSVSNHSMMSADELFSKGRLLPFKNNSQQKTVSTLREELLTSGEEDDNVVASSSGKPPKSGRWKGLLGLRKSHGTSKKQPDNNNNRSVFLPQDNSQNFTGNSE
ncbi:UBA-like domain-containing protein [Heracleum sosnowskyi]|uniref:UBA-like domain-containing protein n=1 Tax=Heracleum sosnowskyi TaxID=360622 RepID=A0AAD8IF54_9APIA|nr:UBA-like domain-containing protein [Heracleum sosnowskyi]